MQNKKLIQLNTDLKNINSMQNKIDSNLRVREFALDLHKTESKNPNRLNDQDNVCEFVDRDTNINDSGSEGRSIIVRDSNNAEKFNSSKVTRMNADIFAQARQKK